MNKTAKEILNMGTVELNKYVAGVIGHKVDRIVSKVSAGGRIIIVFRHETYACSQMEIQFIDGLTKHYLVNYKIGKLEEITR